MNFSIRTLFQKSQIAVFSITFALCVYKSPAAASDTSDSAVELVRSLIESELLAEPNKRYSVAAIEFGGKILSDSQLNESTYPGVVVSYTADPIVVVDGYSIGRVYESKGRVFVSVTFDVKVVTSASGLPGREFHSAGRPTEIVEYKVVPLNNALKIQDPPVPRVSVSALKAQYSQEIEKMSQIVMRSSNPSKGQVAVYDELVRQSEKLNNLVQ